MKSKFYDIKNLKGDVFGGITAGVVALPLALAFGVQSGMGAIAGLYGAMVLGFFASVFGGTNTQVSGPTGPMTVISATVIATAIEMYGGLEAGMGIIIASFLLAGGFQIILGILKIGRYVKYIPYPVLSGFMTGIGVIIILYQLYPFMGHPSAKSTVKIIANIAEPVSAINWQAFLLGSITIAIIYIMPKLTKAIPSALVALVIGTLISSFGNMDVAVIGTIPDGLPQLQFSQLTKITSDDYWIIIEFAGMLAALGAIDSLLTSVIADNITKTKHNSERELFGQGIGNMAAALIGGLPGAGATMRTVVNINAGGRTKLSGMIHGVLLLIVLLGAGKYAAYIPLSVLAGILITVGIGIIDYKGLRHLLRVPRADAAILIIVLLITVFGNLLNAVGLGVVLACVLFMKNASDLAEAGTAASTLEVSPESAATEEEWEDEKGMYEEYKNKIYIKHLYGPLFFGFTSKFQELIKSIGPEVKVVIIRMGRVPHIDQSGVYAMEEAIMGLHNRNVVVLISGIQPQPKDMLKKIDIIPDLVPEMHIFEEFSESKDWLKKNLKEDNGGFQKIIDELNEIKVAYRM